MVIQRLDDVHDAPTEALTDDRFRSHSLDALKDDLDQMLRLLWHADQHIDIAPLIEKVISIRERMTG